MDAQQIHDTLKVAKAEAAVLAGEVEVVIDTTVRQVLEKISKLTELPNAERSILEGILKLASFEDGTALKIKVQNDAMQQTPTEREGSIQALAAASGDSAVAVNLSALGKRIDDTTAELAKMVETGTGAAIVAVREAIAKAGPASAKLEQIKQVFAIKFDAGEDDEWKIRHKVGDLVSMLMQHAALERMLETAPAPAAKADKVKKDETEDAWPRDMAGVPFDAKAGRFTAGDPAWGRDPGRVER